MKTNTYKVTVLNMGHVNVDKGGMTRGTDCGVKMRIPQQAIAVEGNGLKIILDTGVIDQYLDSRKFRICRFFPYIQTIMGVILICDRGFFSIKSKHTMPFF